MNDCAMPNVAAASNAQTRSWRSYPNWLFVGSIVAVVVIWKQSHDETAILILKIYSRSTLKRLHLSLRRSTAARMREWTEHASWIWSSVGERLKGWGRRGCATLLFIEDFGGRLSTSVDSTHTASRDTFYCSWRRRRLEVNGSEESCFDLDCPDTLHWQFTATLRTPLAIFCQIHHNWAFNLLTKSWNSGAA